MEIVNHMPAPCFDMNTAVIRFYEELNDFLPSGRRKIPYPVQFRDNPSVKSIIESEGIPHTEVDLILINGKSVTFSEKVRQGDHISVFPVFESFDISSTSLVRLKPLREPKFVLDVHLGKLTRYLRMLGFDSLYKNNFSDDEIFRISVDERRSVLTRDRRLLMRRDLERGYWIRSQLIPEQVREVISKFDLEKSLHLFSICTLCNGKLQSTTEETARQQYPSYKFYPGTVFYKCISCSHTYWNGSHCERFQESLTSLITQPSPSGI